MTNRQIYENALRLLALSPTDEGMEDLEERSPFLIASFCIEASSTDRYLRESLGEMPSEFSDQIWLSLDEEFPLLSRLAPLASLYVAALLVIDEDAELSDRLYDRYCDGISSVLGDLPAVLEAIEEEYFSN